jgi:pyruvate kinase
MTSGETAAGEFPQETVAMMQQVFNLFFFIYFIDFF